MGDKPSFKGVCRSQKASRPFRGQIFAGNKNYSLGLFAEAEEAARAYDNAAYYTNIAGRKQYATLNFPDEYNCETPPPPSDKTLHIVRDFTLRNGRPVSTLLDAPVTLSEGRDRLLAIYKRLQAIQALAGGLLTAVEELQIAFNGKPFSSAVAAYTHAYIPEPEQPPSVEELPEVLPQHQPPDNRPICDNCGEFASPEAEGSKLSDCCGEPLVHPKTS